MSNMRSGSAATEWFDVDVLRELPTDWRGIVLPATVIAASYHDTARGRSIYTSLVVTEINGTPWRFGCYTPLVFRGAVLNLVHSLVPHLAVSGGNFEPHELVGRSAYAEMGSWPDGRPHVVWWHPPGSRMPRSPLIGRNGQV